MLPDLEVAVVAVMLETALSEARRVTEVGVEAEAGVETEAATEARTETGAGAEVDTKAPAPSSSSDELRMSAR